MSIDVAPAFRITEERTHLIQARNHALPETLPEFVEDILLTKLAEALLPGAPALTKASLAGLVVAAVHQALERFEVCVCPCGHRYSDHLTGRGCCECECTARRPHANELAPGGEPQ